MGAPSPAVVAGIDASHVVTRERAIATRKDALVGANEFPDLGEARVVVRSDPNADRAKAELLERLGFDSLLMLPLRSRGQNWGLFEIYSNDRPFAQDQIELASTVAGPAMRSSSR